jgi:hypothetical protein
MKYMLLIYGAESLQAKKTEGDKQAEMGLWFKYSEDLMKSGAMQAGAPLVPTGSATTVRVRSGKTSNTDGPFAETKEQLGGYYLIDVKDLDEALKWAAKCPGALDGAIEVRAIMDVPMPK